MIELTKLKFGDRVYVVNEKNNAFTKKKIEMTDEDGITWFRYDRDHWEYSIVELEYCGRVTFAEEGLVQEDQNRNTEYHFLYPDGKIEPEYDYKRPGDFVDWFYTVAEAEAYIDYCKKTKNG